MFKNWKIRHNKYMIYLYLSKMIYKITLKFTGKGKGIKITKTVLIKKNAVGGCEDLLYAAISAFEDI